VARELRKAGWKKARALVGGWKAWEKAGLPIESKTIL
jgi:3-mercaptopyruvate sulfurtransferase SseA